MPRRMPLPHSAFPTNGFTPDETVEQPPDSCFTVFQTSHPAPSADHPTAG